MTADPMALAQSWATGSRCRRTKVGCVLIRDGRTLGGGWNRTPDKMPTCSDGGCPRGLLTYEEQPARVGYDRAACIATHAEVMAIRDAGGDVAGSTAYVTHPAGPCDPCRAALIAAGVAAVVWPNGTETL